MRLLLPAALLSVALTGCGTIQHADRRTAESYQTKIIADAFVRKSEVVSNNRVRSEAIRAMQTITVTPADTTKENSASCPDLSAQEAEFKTLCEDHTEGSGDVNIDREAVCGPLRSTLDQLRESCTEGAGGGTEVVFSPPALSAAGVHINLTGASTGDIRFIIQSPGAADQRANGVHDTPAPAPPASVITGMSNGLLDLLGKVAPWATGGLVMREFAGALGEGIRNAGDRDHSVDNSTTESFNPITKTTYPPAMEEQL
jgi:hypothetical protein